MRRLARILLIVGIIAVVFGLSKYHAQFIGHYDFTESSRRAWAIVYCGILLVVCYGLGLPDLPRSIRSGLLISATAAGLSALAVSSVQLVVGDALLPRFVVFGSALLIVPLGTVCAGLSSIGHEAQEERDRVVVVGDEALVGELEARAEPAAGASSSDRDVAHGGGGGGLRGDVYPLMNAVVWSEATVVVLDRQPRSTSVSSTKPPSCTNRASGCAPGPCSTRSGSGRSRCTSSAACRCSSTSARSTAIATGG